MSSCSWICTHTHRCEALTSIFTLRIQDPWRRNLCEHFSYIRKSFVLSLFSVWWHKAHLAASKLITIWWRGWKLMPSVVEHMKGSPYFTEPQFLFHANGILAKINSDYGSHLNNLCYSFWRRGKYQKKKRVKIENDLEAKIVL